MAKKKNIPDAVDAPASGGQLAVRDLSSEAHIANLKTLNNLLVKDTVEHREQIHQLHSKLSSFTEEHDILDSHQRDVFRFVLSSSFADAAARSTAEMAAATETAGNIVKKAELATAELNAAKVRLLAEKDLERVVEERDLARSDLDEKRKELVDLEESIQPLNQALAHMSKEREVADGKCRKLEEVLQSVMREKDLLQRCREFDKHLTEKLVREMEVMKGQKDADMDILKAENKANVSNISALEEMCRLLKETRGQLEHKVEEMKEEKVELVSSNADIKKNYVNVEEDLKRNLTDVGRLEKEKLESKKIFDLKQKEMILKINELKDNMTKMADEKILVDQRNADYEIQISNLQAEVSELQSARKSLEDAHRSCIEIIFSLQTFCAAVQVEKNLKAGETAALKMQINESIEANHIMSLKLQEHQKKLNHQTRENEETNKSYVKLEEDLKRNLTEFGYLEKEKLKLVKTSDLKQKDMALQINELKENMTKMVADKDLVGQKNADYEIQVSNLQAKISELQSARKSLEDAHRSCVEKIGSRETEINLKAKETLAMRMQLHESMKDKYNMSLKLEELQKKLNRQTTENAETKKRINSLIVEKASLEKHLVTSDQALQVIEMKLKNLDDASCQVFALLKKITAEVLDKERTHEDCINTETGVEVGNDEEIKFFVDNLEAIKLSVKGKNTKINDLNQELELLQLSVACAKNKGGTWKWLFPATTTIFAAVSLAYAARAR